MTDIGREGDVQGVELVNDELIGKPIREVGPMLPDTCLVALVTRNGETQVPDADFVVERGDKLTLLGRTSTVREGMKMCRGKK